MNLESIYDVLPVFSCNKTVSAELGRWIPIAVRSTAMKAINTANFIRRPRIKLPLGFEEAS